MRRQVYMTIKVNDPGVVVTEYLRYAGVISVLDDLHTAHPSFDVERELARQPGEALITIPCPRDCDPKIWTAQQSGRLKSFHVPHRVWTEYS